MAEREKKRARRLPTQHVRSMALGGVIKRMGWKLSSFTLCSQGCCWLFFFFCCSCKVNSIHEHKPEAKLLTRVSQTCQTWPWQPESSSHALGWSSSPSLPSPATRCPPCAFNNLQSPEETPQLHKWLIYSSFKKEKKKKERCCTREHLTLAEKNTVLSQSCGKPDFTALNHH